MSDPPEPLEIRAQVDGRDLWWEVADPEDDSVLAFDLGDGPGVHHVRDFFRDRSWTGAGDFDPSTCLRFTSTTNELVGYCAFVVLQSRHPSAASATKAQTLGLLQLGIVPAFRRVDQSTEPPMSYAAAAVMQIEEIAASHDCVAIILAAEAANNDAIEFYERCGFVKDGTYRSKRYEADMQRMRRNLE